MFKILHPLVPNLFCSSSLPLSLDPLHCHLHLPGHMHTQPVPSQLAHPQSSSLSELLAVLYDTTAFSFPVFTLFLLKYPYPFFPTCSFPPLFIQRTCSQSSRISVGSHSSPLEHFACTFSPTHTQARFLSQFCYRALHMFPSPHLSPRITDLQSLKFSPPD